MRKIYIIEDEHALAEAIVLNLELEGYEVEHISHGGIAIKALPEIAKAALVILDVMLPEVSGIEICKKLRETSAIPVLFLSAKGTTADKIAGLKSGGTDYLSKPFELEELLLRVQILVGRANLSTTITSMQIGAKLIDFKTYTVTDTLTLDIQTLTKREIALLHFFAAKENEVVSREDILDVVWGTDQSPTSRTIDNFILLFRKIFETTPKEPKYFHSIRGVGYRFTNVR